MFTRIHQNHGEEKFSEREMKGEGGEQNMKIIFKRLPQNIISTRYKLL